MLFSLQERLVIPKGLRRSETYDWYFSQYKKKPIRVHSRRFVLASMAAAPLVMTDPFSSAADRGFGTPRAEAISFTALIAALIAVLEVIDKSVQLYKEVKAEIELSNPDPDEAKKGKVLSAVFDENEYTENVVAHGQALPAMEFVGSPIRPEGQSLSWDGLVPRGGTYKTEIGLETVRLGDKLLESMTREDVKGDYFKVMTS